MSKCIWKFKLSSHSPQGFVVSADAKVLEIADQHGQPCIWILTSPNAPQIYKYYHVVGTGQSLTNDCGEHVGTFQEFNGELIWHVFENVKPEKSPKAT